jgi:hypothetical protein
MMHVIPRALFTASIAAIHCFKCGCLRGALAAVPVAPQRPSAERPLLLNRRFRRAVPRRFLPGMAMGSQDGLVDYLVADGVVLHPGGEPGSGGVGRCATRPKLPLWVRPHVGLVCAAGDARILTLHACSCLHSQTWGSVCHAVEAAMRACDRANYVDVEGGMPRFLAYEASGGGGRAGAGFSARLPVQLSGLRCSWLEHRRVTLKPEPQH